MTNKNDLINSIETLQITGYIKKKDTKEIIDNLQLIKPKLSHEDKNKIKTIIELLSKKTLKKKEKTKWDQFKKYLMEMVNNYHEEYDDQDDKNMNNEIDSEENILINKIEKILDDKVPEYNKYNKNHPMKGVSYDKSRDRWRYYADNINKKNIKFSEIINTAKENISLYFGEKIFDEVTKKVIKNKHCKIIKYIHNKKSYYDIQHILSQMELKNSYIKKKYNTVKDKIKGYYWHKNKFGGYILRELVTVNTIKLLIKKSTKPATINLANLLNIDTLSYKIPDHETIYINKIIKVFKKEKYITQKFVDCYKIDLYFPDYDLAIECDENNHKNRDPEYESTRQKYIEKKLGATFIRFDPDSKSFDIFDVISKIHYHMKNY